MSASIWKPDGDVIASSNNSVAVEHFTIADVNQSLFTLENFSYVVGTNSLSIYVNGVLQRGGIDYLETSESSFTIVSHTFQLGDVVTAVGLTEVVSSPLNPFGTAQEVHIATEGQTDFIIGSSAYVSQNGSLRAYIDGVVQQNGDSFLELADNTVRFSEPLYAGAEILFIFNSEIGLGQQAAYITYTPAGTGAVTTDVQTKLREWASITEYATPENAVAAALTGTLTVPLGTKLVSNLQLEGECASGYGVGSILKADAGATTVLKLGAVAAPSNWSPRSIDKISIDGNLKSANGVTLQSTAISTEVAGRWTLDGVNIYQCDKAIYKPNGNIGNRFYDINITACDFGLYAVGSSSPLMHGGADVFYAGEINSCNKAAIYIDSQQAGTGGTAFRDLVIEGNNGFAVFVKNWADSYSPLTFDNVWFEANAQSPTTTINAVTYNTVEMHLENTALAVIKNGAVPKSLKLVNSKLSVNNSSINDGPNATYDIDSNSCIYAENMLIDGGAHPFEIKSLVGAKRASGNAAQLHYAPVRSLKAGVMPGLLQSLPYDGAGPFAFPGSITVNGTSVADGRIFSSCCELVIPNGETLVQSSITITSGKWYVWTLDAKVQSGSTSGLYFAVVSNTPLVGAVNRLLTNSWRTLASVSKSATTDTVGMFISNSTGGSVTLRLSAWQIVQFDTEQEAVNYYNSGAYYK